MCLNHNIVHKLYIYEEISRLGWLIGAIFNSNWWQNTRQWSLEIVSIVQLTTDLKIFSFDPILHGVFIYGLPQNPTFKAVVLKFWEIFIKLNQIKIKYEVYIPARAWGRLRIWLTVLFCGAKFCMDTKDSQY